jgi:transposase
MSPQHRSWQRRGISVDGRNDPSYRHLPDQPEEHKHYPAARPKMPTGAWIASIIPPKANRIVQRPTDFALYCERNLIERFFNNLKQFRAIATRYDNWQALFSPPSNSSRLN